MNADLYLNEINSAEKSGSKLSSLANDLVTRAKGALSNHSKTFFEPDEPIIDQIDFMNELEKYAKKNGKSLTIVKLSMMPVILLDGKRYICTLEMPRYLNFPLSIFFVHQYNFGFRFVYLYEDSPNVW